MVRLVVPPHDNGIATFVWPHLYLLRCQVYLLICPRALRAWIYYMRRSKEFRYAYRRTRGGWSWSLCSILGRHDYRWFHGTSHKTTHVHRRSVQHVWHLIGCWAIARWSLNG